MTQYIGTARFGTVTNQAYTGTASTAIVVSSEIFKVRLMSTTDCYVRTDSVTATSSNGVYLPALEPEYVTVTGGQTITAVQVSAGGTLQVAECLQVFDTYIEEDATERRFLLHIVKMQEHIMSDFSKLNADLAALSAKVDALIAKQNPPPVDEQPAVDAADAQVQAMIAKIPA